MNSELTSTMTAMAIAVRTPAAICGRQRRQHDPPEQTMLDVAACARRPQQHRVDASRAVERRNVTTGSRQPSAITATLEKSPMPSQIMNSGMSAGFGTG